MADSDKTDPKDAKPSGPTADVDAPYFTIRGINRDTGTSRVYGSSKYATDSDRPRNKAEQNEADVSLANDERHTAPRDIVPRDVPSYKRGGTKRGKGVARLHKNERILAAKRGKSKRGKNVRGRSR